MSATDLRRYEKPVLSRDGVAPISELRLLQAVLLVELLEAVGLVEKLDVLTERRCVMGLDELYHPLSDFVAVELVPHLGLLLGGFATLAFPVTVSPTSLFVFTHCLSSLLSLSARAVI